ncbi:MAG: hypothetical protein ACLPHI_22370 [Terriglobales bacterium]|jgi:hypothetical protein
MWKCEEEHQQFRKEALAAWTHYRTTGRHATAEAADSWLAKLEEDEEALPPTSGLALSNT